MYDASFSIYSCVGYIMCIAEPTMVDRTPNQNRKLILGKHTNYPQSVTCTCIFQLTSWMHWSQPHTALTLCNAEAAVIPMLRFNKFYMNMLVPKCVHYDVGYCVV